MIASASAGDPINACLIEKMEHNLSISPETNRTRAANETQAGLNSILQPEPGIKKGFLNQILSRFKPEAKAPEPENLTHGPDDLSKLNGLIPREAAPIDLLESNLVAEWQAEILKDHVVEDLEIKHQAYVRAVEEFGSLETNVESISETLRLRNQAWKELVEQTAQKTPMTPGLKEALIIRLRTQPVRDAIRNQVLASIKKIEALHARAGSGLTSNLFLTKIAFTESFARLEAVEKLLRIKLADFEKAQAATYQHDGKIEERVLLREKLTKEMSALLQKEGLQFKDPWIALAEIGNILHGRDGILRKLVISELYETGRPQQFETRTWQANNDVGLAFSRERNTDLKAKDLDELLASNPLSARLILEELSLQDFFELWGSGTPVLSRKLDHPLIKKRFLELAEIRLTKRFRRNPRSNGVARTWADELARLNTYQGPFPKMEFKVFGTKAIQDLDHGDISKPLNDLQWISKRFTTQKSNLNSPLFIEVTIGNRPWRLRLKDSVYAGALSKPLDPAIVQTFERNAPDGGDMAAHLLATLTENIGKVAGDLSKENVDPNDRMTLADCFTDLALAIQIFIGQK